MDHKTTSAVERQRLWQWWQTALRAVRGSIPASPTSFLLHSTGLAKASRQQKAAISRETSAVEVKLRGKGGKPTISLRSRWNRNFQDINARDQGNNSRQYWMAPALEIANQKWNFI